MIDASGHAPTLESLSDFRSLREWRGSQVVLLFRPKPLSLLYFGPISSPWTLDYEPIQAAQQDVRPFYCDRIR